MVTVNGIMVTYLCCHDNARVTCNTLQQSAAYWGPAVTYDEYLYTFHLTHDNHHSNKQFRKGVCQYRDFK